MAHFYGQVQGSGGAVHRLGGASGGMHTIAASWEGAVHVRLYHKDGRDFARVFVTSWEGSRTQERTLYDGAIKSEEVTNAAPRQDGTPAQARRAFDAIVQRAAVQCETIMREQVPRVLNRSKRYSEFVAAMGACSFYDAAGMPISDKDLTGEAIKAIGLAADYTAMFGSPGQHLKAEGPALTGGRDEH
jgi:hypothetical protein